jgi:hypothetical protein
VCLAIASIRLAQCTAIMGHGLCQTAQLDSRIVLVCALRIESAAMAIVARLRCY